MNTPLAEAPIPAGWKHVERPPSLFRRFEFEDYAQTRTFLAQLEELSKAQGLYPDLGFGRQHVNVTIHLAGGDGQSEAGRAFAAQASAIATALQRP